MHSTPTALQTKGQQRRLHGCLSAETTGEHWGSVGLLRRPSQPPFSSANVTLAIRCFPIPAAALFATSLTSGRWYRLVVFLAIVATLLPSALYSVSNEERGAK